MGLGILLRPAGSRPSVAVLPPGYVIPSPSIPLPDRWIPMQWGWLWKLRYALLGKPPVIDIDTKLLRLGGASDTMLRDVLTAQVALSLSNGVQGYLLPEAELADLGRRLEAEVDCGVSRGKMTSGAGVLATLSMTQAVQINGVKVPVGDVITYAIVKCCGNLELTGSFHPWSAVTNAVDLATNQADNVQLRTNISLAASMCIPDGHGVLLYKSNRGDERIGGVGVLIRTSGQ